MRLILGRLKNVGRVAIAALTSAIVVWSCATAQAPVDCTSPQTMCNSVCANLQLDPDNCGAKCKSGQACVNGTCSSSCASTATLCTPDGGGAAICVNTKADNANC